MRTTYYNENDPKAAAWLRELIRAGLIPAGDVDERSICDVSPHDLRGYIQQHFFAGIGGWAFALRLAGWPDDRPVRTGSCPCQPFSAAGKGLGDKDARHLWPVFRDLITFGEAAVTFGEQVASAAGRVWLARVRADLEGLGYGVGAADLCSAGVGSPNIRQRLLWMAHATGSRCDRRAQSGATGRAAGEGDRENREISGRIKSSRNSPTRRLADTASPSGAQQQRKPRRGVRRPSPTPYAPECGGPDSACGLGDADGAGSFPWRQAAATNGHGCSAVADGDACGLGHTDEPGPQGRHERRHGANQWTPWSASVVLPCTDGKSRRIEPGSFPLAHGVSGRVGLLRGYGNAINPWLAAEFVLACEDALTP